jgi:hypothetical protein
MTLFNFILEGLSADIKKQAVSHHLMILSVINSNINQTAQMLHITGDCFFNLYQLKGKTFSALCSCHHLNGTALSCYIISFTFLVSKKITLFHYVFKMFLQASENVKFVFVTELPTCPAQWQMSVIVMYYCVTVVYYDWFLSTSILYTTFPPVAGLLNSSTILSLMSCTTTSVKQKQLGGKHQWHIECTIPVFIWRD